MSIKADMKYNGVVAPGSALYETQTGTLGYQVQIECNEGETSFTIWLTDKNRERAKKYFAVLGVDERNLQSQSYIENQLALDIEGKEISFGTKDEEYNGKHSVKVVYIGKKTDPNVARGAAKFFGGNPPEITPETIDKRPIDDNDIPF
jgi:hypothetical protein